MTLFNIPLARPGFRLAMTGLVLFVLQGCTGAGSSDSGGGGGGGGQSARAACLANDATYVNTFLSALTTNHAAQGGQLYDKWWAALGFGAGPATDHPVWADQSTNTRTGSDTWRCKECHGWDYKGAAGAYGPASSHYTGFPGIFSASSKNAVEVFCDIKAGTANNANHQFNSTNTGGQITDVQILYLTKFITSASTSGGMADSSTFITPGTSTAIGDAGAGQTVFTNTAGCGSASCHDSDGTQNAGSHTIGELATDNPWEVLHKIRYGHPNSSMPAFVSSPTLTTTQMQNVLAYSQTLPLPGGGGGSGGGSATDTERMVLGGLLYDSWMSELGITPSGTNPLWAFQSTNTRTGSTTWRCKECHGWDYKGAAGAYGPSSSHYTGFPGVLNVAMDSTTSEAEVFDRIRDGFVNPFNGARIHNFGIYLNDTQIDALAYFIKNGGVIDTDPYILSFLKFGLGDATNGLALYSFAGFGVANGNCALCHDDDGQAINFGTVTSPEYLGGLSRDNPWEVLHKARFGQPDSNMPAMIQSGLTLDDAADVLTHVQSLP